MSAMTSSVEQVILMSVLAVDISKQAQFDLKCLQAEVDAIIASKIKAIKAKQQQLELHMNSLQSALHIPMEEQVKEHRRQTSQQRKLQFAKISKDVLSAEECSSNEQSCRQHSQTGGVSRHPSCGVDVAMPDNGHKAACGDCELVGADEMNDTNRNLPKTLDNSEAVKTNGLATATPLRPSAPDNSTPRRLRPLARTAKFAPANQSSSRHKTVKSGAVQPALLCDSAEQTVRVPGRKHVSEVSSRPHELDDQCYMEPMISGIYELGSSTAPDLPSIKWEAGAQFVSFSQNDLPNFILLGEDDQQNRT